MKKQKRKLLLFIIVTIMIVVLGGVVIFFFRSEKSLELYIDGVQISEEEYADAMQREVYDVTRYFYETYGASVDSEFWEKDFQGEVPSRMLAERTIEQLKYNHAVYKHAKELKYIDSATYEALLERMEAENALRKEKVQKGEPVYGLMEYTQDLYREYEMDIFQKKYCENIENAGMNISEEERQAYYEEKKDILFVAYDDLKIDYITMYYETEEEAKEIRKRLTELYKKMDAQHPMKALVQEEFKDLEEYFFSEEIASEEYGLYLKNIPDVLEYAKELEAGTSTQVIEENNTFYLIECLGKVEHDYQPIEEVKDIINKDLRETKYESLIEEQAAKMQVECNIEKIYIYTKNIYKS